MKILNNIWRLGQIIGQSLSEESKDPEEPEAEQENDDSDESRLVFASRYFIDNEPFYVVY